MQIRLSKEAKIDTIYQNLQLHLTRMAEGMRMLVVVEFNRLVLTPISVIGFRCGATVKLSFESIEFKSLGMCK